MIQRCAWHRRYYGWTLLKGVAAWRPFGRLEFSDGICDPCLERFRAGARPAAVGRLAAALCRLAAQGPAAP